MFPILQKPVSGFALQINWLVSDDGETLVVNRLNVWQGSEYVSGFINTEWFQRFLVSVNLWNQSVLTNLMPMFPFYTPWKRQKTSGFLMVLEGIEREHRAVIDYESL